MEYKITISKRAEKKLDTLFKYLEQEWSGKVKNDFKLKLLKEVDYLRQNPYMFPATQTKKGVRKCIITKCNVL